jgi:hypothetical protein
MKDAAPGRAASSGSVKAEASLSCSPSNSQAVVIDLERYRMRRLMLACLRAAICHDCIGRRGPHACRWCSLHPERWR